MIFCITNFCQTKIKWLISTTYYSFMLFWAESSTLNFTYRFEERSVLIGPDICKVRRSIISLNKNCFYFFFQKVKFIRGQQSLLQYTWKHRLPHCHRHITGFLNSVWLILYNQRSFEVNNDHIYIQNHISLLILSIFFLNFPPPNNLLLSPFLRQSLQLYELNNILYLMKMYRCNLNNVLVIQVVLYLSIKRLPVHWTANKWEIKSK